MRILITGGSGFVGGHLQSHLRERGDTVFVLDPELDIALAQDVKDEFARYKAEGIDAVLHLAGLANVKDSFESSTEVYRVNVLGTANVLECARYFMAGSKMVVISSSEVYGVVDPALLPVNEDADLSPLSPYAASKAAMEQIALQAVRAYGQRVVVARPFNHIGPGQSEDYLVSALAKRIIEAQRAGNSYIKVGNIESERDFTDVRDVVRAYTDLAERGVPGQIYNVCSGRPISVRMIADMLIELSGAELRLETDPALIRNVEVSRVFGDCSKIRNQLGWTPLVPIAESLRDVLEWWSIRL